MSANDFTFRVFMDDTADISFLDYTIPQFVAEECNINPRSARSVVQLFKEGCEVAYVARYRCQQTGNLSCEQVRKAFEAFQNAKEIEKKVDKAVTNLKGKLEGEQLKDAIDRLKQARDFSDITEVTQQFVTKGKKTKADKARELGLGTVADDIFKGKTVDLEKYVDGKELRSVKDVSTQVSILLADSMNRLQPTIDAVKRITQMNTRVFLTVEGSFTNKAKKMQKEGKDDGQLVHFREYSQFKKDARRVENHQILALSRGEEKEIITWKVDIEHAEKEHPCLSHRVAPPHISLFKTAFQDSITRLFVPKLARSIRRFLINRAEQAAIDCFVRNLSQLFAQLPISGRYVLALDPGYNACKVAFLSPKGEVIATAEFNFRSNKFDENAKRKIIEWSKQCEGEMIVAIGNGKASVETQKAVAGMIKEREFGECRVKFCVISENGASKYSITELAEKELPGMPATQRSAVSIGRRIIDPISEFVKIDPKHLGMGMYQHSVNEKRLSDALSLVVRECVSLRGVDLNTASLQLLQQVCGLNKKTAAGIIAFREKEGGFVTREQLKKVKGLGEKAFEQCAGFLTVSPSSPSSSGPPTKKKVKKEHEELDSTVVHPTQYPIARRILKRVNLSVAESQTENGKRILKELSDLNEDECAVRDLLVSETYLIDPPPLMTEIRKLSSFKSGERTEGRVSNQTDFGVFIDIGAETAGLAHKSTIRGPVPMVGTSVRVEILRVEPERNRMSLKIID